MAGDRVRARRTSARELTFAALLAVPLLAAAGPLVPTSMQPVPAGLPPLPNAWQLPNPYRGNAGVLASGSTAYAEHCARCHGEPSRGGSPEGPDLRRLNGFCRQLKDAALQPRCLKDVDAYYLQSVREGKVRAGVVHMPAWQGLLPQETIWAIRSFTESLAPAPPRTLPDLPAGGAPVVR